MVKYILIIAATAALCGAEYAGIRPCGAGFAAALIYCGTPALIVLPSFILFSVIFDFSLSMLAYTLAVSICVFAAALISMRFKRAKKPLYCILLVLSQASLVLKHTDMGYLLAPVWGMFALGIFVASVCFLTPVLKNKLSYKLLETELISGGVLLICASLGLSRMSFYRFDMAYLFAAFAVVFTVAVGSLSGAVACGMCFGSGMAIASGNVAAIAFTAFAALVTSVFGRAPKPIASLSCIASYILVSYLFSLPPAWQQIVCFASGALVAALIPKSTADKIHTALFAPVTAAAARGIIERVATETGNSLIGASRIFDDMKSAMEQVPELEKTGELETKVCSKCKRYGYCSNIDGFKDALINMERSSAALGRASVAQIPALLSECANLSALVAGATDAAQNSHEQHIVSEAKREGRKVVSQQLGLMSCVLRQLGERVKTPSKFDSRKENDIAVELSYLGAAVPEVIVTDDSVSVVIKNGDLTSDKVEAAVSRIMRTPYKFVRLSADVLPGYVLMLFARAPRYDVAFSVAASAKEGRSGDNHSFIHLGGDRFMMALCDGMGSGEEAEKASETAIELVESFFKAGLDSMSAVECTNRFLALNECERFSTLDITVIDLNSGESEIIKLSSPATIIKSSDGVSAVSGSALPMGIFENVKCGHAHATLKAGDEIIMATDGITDAFGSTEQLISAAASQNSADPQTEAHNILEYALSMQNGKLRDDATVLCARIFEKRR